MENSYELDGKYLGTITEDFVVIAETLKEASYQIRKQGFSSYPIFVISKTSIPIGRLLIDKNEVAIKWNVFASYIDEFVQLQLIGKDKLDAFKETYKNPDEFCCLFVVDESFTNFLFIPYPQED